MTSTASEREVSSATSHHSSSDAARQVTGTSSSTCTSSPAPSSRLRSRPGAASRKGPGASGIGSFGEPQAERRPAGDRQPRISLALGPDGDRGPSAGTQHPGELAYGRIAVGHEHHPEATEHAVEGRGRQSELGGIRDREVDVVEPELGGAAACGVDHLRDAVRREQASVGCHVGRGEQARVPRPGCDLEEVVTGRRVEEGDEPLGDLTGRIPHERPAALPAARDGAPRVELCAPSGRVTHARPPPGGMPDRQWTHARPSPTGHQKAGMISRP